MPRLFGIDWVPWWRWDISMKRRMQALAVFIGAYLPVFGGFHAIFILTLLFCSVFFTWLTILYLIWFWCTINVSKRGGLRAEWFRRSAWSRWLCEYYPLSLVKTADLDPSQKYIIGYHPHGYLGVGGSNFSTDVTGFSAKFPGITPYLLSLRLFHYLPILRELLMAGGYCDVSRESIDYIIRKAGSAVVILIGGAKEALEVSSESPVKLVLKDRMGFVKLALNYGANLVPSFTFGETEVTKTLYRPEEGSRVRQLQRWIQRHFFGVPVAFTTGRDLLNYTFGIMPRRHPVTTVVGEPIAVEKDERPSPDKIASLHEKYMVKLNELFEQHKGTYGYLDRVIQLIR